MSQCKDVREIEPDLQGAALRVGIVMSRFNRDVGEGLLSACCRRLGELGVKPTHVTIATVPGALEQPLVLQTMAQSGRSASPAARQHSMPAYITEFMGTPAAQMRM